MFLTMVIFLANFTPNAIMTHNISQSNVMIVFKLFILVLLYVSTVAFS
jgi:hypothetical protein